MEKYGFVYIWYDKKRKMYYIGNHWGTIDDGYICSSNRMWNAYRKRPADFKRRIIETNISKALKGKIPKNLENLKKSFWWNNGTINKRSMECPGENWNRGQLR